MAADDITYVGSNGVTFHGRLVSPENPNGGAVLIGHSLAGLQAFERDVCDDFAALGYVALAIDYIGEGRILGPEEYWPFNHKHTADPTHLLASFGGGYDILRRHPSVSPDRIAGVGYCYGGVVALEFAKTGAEMPAVIGLHTPLPVLRPELNRSIKGRVQIINAANDPYVPWDERIVFEKQMDAAGLDWEMTLLGCAPHAFTAPNSAETSHGLAGVGYSERAASRSWKLMTDFLAETVGPA